MGHTLRGWHLVVFGTFLFGAMLTHIAMMIGPMFWWGELNLLLFGSTLLLFWQSLVSACLMLERPEYVVLAPSWVRLASLILAYVGGIWWVITMIAEVIMLFTGKKFMAEMGSIIQAYILLLNASHLVPSISIIFKEATIDNERVRRLWLEKVRAENAKHAEEAAEREKQWEVYEEDVR